MVPAELQAIMVNLLHKDHAGVDRMKQAAPHITWKSMDSDLRRKIIQCVGCYNAGKNIKPTIPKTERSVLNYPSQPNEEIQLDCHGTLEGSGPKMDTGWGRQVFKMAGS